jgi:hypothetical protein
MTGREMVVAITDGRFDDSAELVEVFGPWEQIFCGEVDGRRWQTRSLKKPYAPGFIAW